MAKRFEELFDELNEKVRKGTDSSRTVQEYNAGTHAIGKKIVEEAAEVWMAAEFQSKAELAEEISQLLYHVQVLMLANDVTLEEVYEVL
jgi:phosphoribosyl-ATP pyrophosphohydrolase